MNIKFNSIINFSHNKNRSGNVVSPQAAKVRSFEYTELNPSNEKKPSEEAQKIMDEIAKHQILYASLKKQDNEVYQTYTKALNYANFHAPQVRKNITLLEEEIKVAQDQIAATQAELAARQTVVSNRFKNYEDNEYTQMLIKTEEECAGIPALQEQLDKFKKQNEILLQQLEEARSSIDKNQLDKEYAIKSGKINKRIRQENKIIDELQAQLAKLNKQEKQ